MVAVETYVTENLLRSFFLLIVALVAVFYVLCRLVGGDVVTAQQGQAEWVQNKGKNGRLD